MLLLVVDVLVFLELCVVFHVVVRVIMCFYYISRCYYCEIVMILALGLRPK
jgi:hypothetical protein